MMQIVKCPACAAPLEIAGDPYEICDFCGSRIAISSQNTISPGSFGFDGLLNQAHKLKEVLYLARAGRKIEAIKIYRETFGGGLAEAKEAVENLVVGKPLNYTNFQMFSINAPLQNSSAPFGYQANNLAEIQAELRRGNKINAIKIYREKFGVGLKEAKDAVDALEQSEAVSYHAHNPLRFNDQAIAKTTKTIGWITAIFVLLGILGALAGIGVAFFSVIESSQSILPVPTPINGTKSQNPATNNQSGFAAEVLRFGGEGVGGGFFRDNRLIAIDGDGRVYSADYNGGQLQQFDATGKFLGQLSGGENMPLLDLTADKKNRVYVLSVNKLEVFDGATQQSLSRIERPNYESLALDVNGKLYALTSNGELVKVDENGKPADKPVSLSKQLNYGAGKLSDLAIDGANNFYVFDAGKKYVLKYSPDAKFLIRFDSPANKDKTLGFVHDLAIDAKGRIFIAETNRIHLYDNDGRYLDSFETRQSFGLAFDNQNALWTASRPFIVKYELRQ